MINFLSLWVAFTWQNSWCIPLKLILTELKDCHLASPGLPKFSLRANRYKYNGMFSTPKILNMKELLITRWFPSSQVSISHIILHIECYALQSCDSNNLLCKLCRFYHITRFRFEHPPFPILHIVVPGMIISCKRFWELFML